MNKKEIHPNYIKASNLLFCVIGVFIAHFVIDLHLIGNSLTYSLLGIGIVIFVSLGLLVREGFSSMKYILIFLDLIGILSLPMIVFSFNPTTISGIFNIIQQIIIVWVVVLLFLIPKKKE